MGKYAPCWNCGSTKVRFADGHVRIALCGNCSVRCLSPQQASALERANNPVPPIPEPEVDIMQTWSCDDYGCLFDDVGRCTVCGYELGLST